ncbi:MAG: hypothetical protein F9K40_00535 [Kofleriaceae bacterium]|nr:MAG: hypothetical protein F9K40_00535 [Kofleriaceae bacterium]MBZ0231764.1 hypothetical protein [Kofleriaceae bacterium]
MQALRSLPQFLFWSAPKAFDAEFVIEDPLALDYLSQQVGNWLFGGLTTRTSRAQYFAMVLYGLHLVDEHVSSRVVGATDDERKELFERYERLWALAVHEHRDGNIPISDGDAIRGFRGVARTWKPGDGPLPLDYKLIGRQSELGALGAYLTSLRREDTSLVFPGTLRPTAVAADIIDAFWEEPGSGVKTGAYRNLVELAFDLERSTVPRKHGAITLARVGGLSRLSVLTQRPRPQQRVRLWNVIFEAARDDTLPFAMMVRSAAQREIYEPREILVQALAGKLGGFTPNQRDKLAMALAFGDVQQELLSCFNRAFAAAVDGGYRCHFGAAAMHSLAGTAGEPLRLAAARLLDEPEAARFRRLPVHGEAFIRLVTQLRDATPVDGLAAIVTMHAAVHRERRHATPWLRIDGDRLVVDVGGYGERARAEGQFPGLKLGVVRSLLTDLGKLP